jgi:hypothetical protein
MELPEKIGFHDVLPTIHLQLQDLHEVRPLLPLLMLEHSSTMPGEEGVKARDQHIQSVFHACREFWTDPQKKPDKICTFY